ncbi:MAG TPA: acyl-CoA dehydrogenase family protein, partial [Candidatus Binataceae bacterium]|nr:acyl-CoA dehydrogenase family protein [Candidatus Binataceae bacterium]
MAGIDYEVGLSDTERSVWETVHRFAEEVMRPAGIKLDAMADPNDVIARDSVLWEVHRKHRALGLDDLTGPNSDLPPAQQARLRCLISEEMGWGDSGLAISLGVAGFPKMLAQMSGKPDLVERFSAEDCIGCWPGTEPDHGSDMIYYMNKLDVEPP